MVVNDERYTKEKVIELIDDLLKARGDWSSGRGAGIVLDDFVAMYNKENDPFTYILWASRPEKGAWPPGQYVFEVKGDELVRFNRGPWLERFEAEVNRICTDESEDPINFKDVDF